MQLPISVLLAVLAASQTSALPTAASGSALFDAVDVEKRWDPCQQYPASWYTPNPSNVNDGDAATWQSSSIFSGTAQNATTPSGWALIDGWTNLNASAQSNAYQGYTSDLTSYDTNKCAARCSSIKGCTSFVIYFERDPTINPDDNQCPNPQAQTFIKCAFYGIPPVKSEATNVGQWQSHFNVRIAGSNAYTMIPTTPSGYSAPVSFGRNTIESPDDSYMGVQQFPNQTYDPNVCAQACNDKTQFAIDHPDQGRKCSFFDAFMAYKNYNTDTAIFTCTFYTRPWGAQYATNQGQTRDGDRYSQGFSYGFSVLGG